jgi:hypothetical protein
MLIRGFPPVASMEKPPPVHNRPVAARDRILVLSSRLLVGMVISLALKEVRSHSVASRLPQCFRSGLLTPSLRNRKRGLLFSSTDRGGKIAEEDDMLKRSFSGTLAAAALGVAASGAMIRTSPRFFQLGACRRRRGPTRSTTGAAGSSGSA